MKSNAGIVFAATFSLALFGVGYGGFAQAMSKKQAPATPSSPVTASVSTAPPSNAIWVARGAEAKSCEKGSGISLQTMESDLSRSGVKIFDRKIFKDPKMRIQMCGSDQGDLNGYLIPPSDLAKAEGLGFKTFNPAIRN